MFEKPARVLGRRLLRASAVMLVAGAVAGCVTHNEIASQKDAGALLPAPAVPGGELPSPSHNQFSGQPVATKSGQSGSAAEEELVEVQLDGLSIANAVGLAIARHPDINRAQAVVARSELQVAVAKSAWYPTVSYGFDPGYYANSDIREAKVGVGVEQLLFDFGRSRSRISAAKATLEQEQYLLADTIESVAYNTASTFIDLAASQEMIAAAGRQVQSLRETKDKIQTRVKAGLSDTSDLNQAEVAIQRAEAEALSAQTQFDDAAGKLAELAGVRPARVASLDATTAIINEMGQGAQSEIENTPAILAAKASVSAADQRVKLAKAGRFPSIGVAVNEELSSVKDRSGDYGHDTHVGLTLSGDFSLGGLNKHQISTAIAERRAEAQALENQRMLTRTALGSAETQAAGASARLVSFQSVIDLSRSLIDLYWQQYTLDKRPLTDVINAERDMYQAEVQRISAIADGASAQVKANAAVGQLATQLKAKKSS
ncbi:MAG: TolC family protein [Mesorhizobium sp.]